MAGKMKKVVKTEITRAFVPCTCCLGAQCPYSSWQDQKREVETWVPDDTPEPQVIAAEPTKPVPFKPKLKFMG